MPDVRAENLLEKELRMEGDCKKAEGFVSLLGQGHIAEGREKLVQIL